MSKNCQLKIPRGKAHSSRKNLCPPAPCGPSWPRSRVLAAAGPGSRVVLSALATSQSERRFRQALGKGNSASKLVIVNHDSKPAWSLSRAYRTVKPGGMPEQLLDQDIVPLLP